MNQLSDIIKQGDAADIAVLFGLDVPRAEAIFHLVVITSKRILHNGDVDRDATISNVGIVQQLSAGLGGLGHMKVNETAFACYVIGFYHAKMEAYLEVESPADAD